uniref:Uncharacterized protein n=1 Tax=Lepeophtheirus salmonis TaxID=72036 RepID=A0A0K2TCW7_LEPSM
MKDDEAREIRGDGGPGVVDDGFLESDSGFITD